MVNKKRDRNGYRKQLGRYRLSRDEIITIENMLAVYADAREAKFIGVDVKPGNTKRKHRKSVDLHTKVGRYRPFHITIGRNEFGVNYAGVDYIHYVDSIKLLPKLIKRTRYLKMDCFPGVSVTFTPFTTTIYAQTHYATGPELMAMKRVVLEIENYLSLRRKSFVNTCVLVH